MDGGSLLLIMSNGKPLSVSRKLFLKREAIFLHQGLQGKEQVSGDRTDILSDSTASTTTSLINAVILG